MRAYDTERWLARDPDPVTRRELETLIEVGDDVEIHRRFSQRLAFGTAGLRGVVGAGPGMMNALVIRETAAGLGQYLLSSIADAAQRGVVVAYDGRLDSRRFAKDVACVLAGMKIKTFITPDVAATPLGAFGVLQQEAAAGVVVTASHNPPQYNGFKVYWENGAQIVSPQDSDIAQAIDRATEADIPWVDFDTGRASGLITVLDKRFYRDYIDTITGNPLFQIDGELSSTSVAYTAMHGVGASIAKTLLNESGFKEFYSVQSQQEPDGHFPTVAFPNPEEPGAMDAVLALAQQHQTTLACANDPDADRLAVAVRTERGDYRMLTGDMLGVLLADYLLCKPYDYVPIVCTTIVSSSLLQRIAVTAGAQFFTTLTGFKWLANVGLSHEDDHHRCLFAYEEALGYAIGQQVRDKDGLSALLAFVQLTESLAREGKTVLGHLESLYRKYGIHLTEQRSLALVDGAMPLGDALRATPPKSIAGREIESVDDLQHGMRTFGDGRIESLELPPSDVLIYRLADNSRVIVRPSGTEPKVKCYYEVVEPVGEGDFELAMGQASSALEHLIQEHQASLLDVS